MGFRGDQDAGKRIQDGKDPVTGVEIASLYGKNKKPSAEMLAGLDMVLFDIQDVGARFYTYTLYDELCHGGLRRKQPPDDGP